MSVVGNVPITLDELKHAVRTMGKPPLEALRALQNRELLAAEASRRGISNDFLARHVVDQAMVQALLKQAVEAGTGAADLAEDLLRKAYERQRARFHRDEMRASVHVLARVPEGASAAVDEEAKRMIERVVEELATAPSPESVVDKYRQPLEHPLGFTRMAEDVPAMPRNANAAEPYKEALFERTKPGPVDRAVRTTFGWHAIVLTSITPPVHRTFAEAEADLRRELSVELRKKRLGELLDSLKRRLPSSRDPKGEGVVLSRAFDRVVEER